MCRGVIVDPYYHERSGLYIGMGTTMLSRAGMFRVPHGIAVDLNNRVFRLPSFHSKLLLFLYVCSVLQLTIFDSQYLTSSWGIALTMSFLLLRCP